MSHCVQMKAVKLLILPPKAILLIVFILLFLLV